MSFSGTSIALTKNGLIATPTVPLCNKQVEKNVRRENPKRTSAVYLLYLGRAELIKFKLT